MPQAEGGDALGSPLPSPLCPALSWTRIPFVFPGYISNSSAASSDREAHTSSLSRPFAPAYEIATVVRR